MVNQVCTFLGQFMKLSQYPISRLYAHFCIIVFVGLNLGCVYKLTLPICGMYLLVHIYVSFFFFLCYYNPHILSLLNIPQFFSSKFAVLTFFIEYSSKARCWNCTWKYFQLLWCILDCEGQMLRAQPGKTKFLDVFTWLWICTCSDLMICDFNKTSIPVQR